MQNYFEKPDNGDIVIKNIAKIVSGDFHKGIIEGADTIVCRKGKIAQIGKESEVDFSDINLVVDANGQVAIPGLIDGHLHNTLDDYAPQRGAVGCYTDALLYGTTTMISEGEQGPGYPRFYNDPIGVKATAIMAARVFESSFLIFVSPRIPNSAKAARLDSMRALFRTLARFRWTLDVIVS